jgi:hypothetical protein
MSYKSFYRHSVHIPGQQYIIIIPCVMDKLSRYNQINAQYQCTIL